MSAQQQSRFVRLGFRFPIRLLLPAAAALLMTGCNVILWGNIGVLAVAVGIFLGTVFLSRSSAASRSASRSLSPTSSGASANSAADGTRS